MNSIAEITCFPNKAQYFKGDIINILIECEPLKNISEINFIVTELDKIILHKKMTETEFLKEGNYYKLSFDLPVGNYGVDISMKSEGEEKEAHTAFDVVDSYTTSIRYGFLTDFSEKDKEDRSDILNAVKLHLNTLQFYDWMYRHDKLVSDAEEYKEPLGREISSQTIVNKIHECKEHGIRPFAYGAVYAASKEAFQEHPDWAFLKKNKEALTYADWLVFMDTSDNSPWSKHIIKEYTDAVSKLGFQGIHMDTYGFPKYAWNNDSERVSLAETFSGLINNTKSAVKQVDENAGVIFNAVNNWPSEYVAKSEQDTIYIEVWPPHITYQHLYSLIREAKYLGNKNVTLAAYIEAFKNTKTEEDVQAAETSFLLTNAVIQASGGTQIVLGETNGILCDSYFVNYAVLRDEFLPTVKSYCDFTVRYGTLLYNVRAMDISMTAANGINNDIMLSVKDNNSIQFSSCGEPDKVWSIIRESDRYLIIQMINLTDENEFWNQPKYHRPRVIRDIQVNVLLDADIKGIFYATPDDGSCVPVKMEYEIIQMENGQHILFQIPKLEIWNLIWIEVQ